MAITLRKNSCGFTLFEFAVSAALLGTLSATLLSRTAFYQDEADRVAAQQLVATLRTALQLRAMEVSSRRERGFAGLVEENPLDWLLKKPDNYLGEYYSPDLEKMPSGNWVFDRRDKTLIYLLNSHKSFYSNASNLLKFKVKFVHITKPTGLTNGPAEVPKGVVLAQISDEASPNTD